LRTSKGGLSLEPETDVEDPESGHTELYAKVGDTLEIKVGVHLGI